ncbi:MAG: hypothetical protein ACI32E_00490 [Bacilli bacterium]
MNKRIIKIIVSIFLIIISMKTYNVIASQDTKVNLIFDKVTYTQGETIRLNINLENFANLNETRIVIKINEKKLVPLKVNNQYGQLLKSSIYEEALLNEYVGGGYIRFHLIKKSLTTGYYSGYKNNIGEFYFEAKEYIANIYELFQLGSFETLNSGINISLYDIYNQNIDYTVQYSEKIKVIWDNEKYVIEVFDEIPNYEDDIKVLNRDNNEYEIIYQSDIDNHILSTGVINVVMLDKTNGDYILLSKTIEVVDSISPSIIGENSVIVNSSDFDSFDETSLFEVKDNFDQNPLVDILYYDENGELLDNRDIFIKYMNHHQNGLMKIKAIDSSLNKSLEFVINVQINDNTPPVISASDSYELLDIYINEFNFEKIISITDDYDEYPLITFKSYYNQEEVNYLDELKKGHNVIFKYSGIDKSGNCTKEYTCIVKVKDTTSPLVNQISDIIINDKELSQFKFSKDITYSDNIDPNPSLILNYYLDNKLVSYDNWLKGLATKGMGNFSYYVKDASMNTSDTFNINVKVNDTTAPIIRVNNIKNDSKYTKIDKINYEIIDNFEGIINSVVTLNNVLYENTTIDEPGTYEFKIIASDASGNTSEETINFTIVKNNFLGFSEDLSYYAINYLDVIIIASILMIVIMTIIIIRLITSYRKKKLR